MKMKKKIISATLAAAIISCSALTGFAAETENTESSSGRGFTVIEKTSIPNNTARFYTSGQNVDETSGIAFYDAANSDREVARCCFEGLAFELVGGHKDLNLPDPNGYRYLQCLDGGTGGNINNRANFNATGGDYECIRIKLSDYDDYFNSDGTRTEEANGKPHNYNFTRQIKGKKGDKLYLSSLIFMSGGAITGVAPTKDGYADIYVSTKLGEETNFMTGFVYKVPGAFGSGGGLSIASFNDFMIGNIDDDGHISISDAVAIQKYSLNIATGFDELSKRNADANRDGRITVTDAIAVLKYAVMQWE